MDSIGKTHEITVKTLSPLHIGGTITFSPNADYYLSNNRNQICFLDDKAVGEIVHQKQKVNEFVEMVKRTASENKSKVLRCFFQNELRMNIESLEPQRRFPLYWSGNGNPVEIGGCLGIEERAYIP